jgi:hypothetical protein
MNIYKDYHLNNGCLEKKNIKEKKHLMWKFGGVPCIDADNVWDKWQDKIDKIKIITDKGTIFETTKGNFNQHKQEVDFGFGRQYYIYKENWDDTKRI